MRGTEDLCCKGSATALLLFPLDEETIEDAKEVTALRQSCEA